MEPFRFLTFQESSPPKKKLKLFNFIPFKLVKNQKSGFTPFELEKLPNEIIGFILNSVDLKDLSVFCRLNKNLWELCHSIGIKRINILKRDIIEQKTYSLLELLLEFACRYCTVTIENDSYVFLTFVLLYETNIQKQIEVTHYIKLPDGKFGIETTILFVYYQKGLNLEIADEASFKIVFDYMMNTIDSIMDSNSIPYLLVEKTEGHLSKISIRELKKELDNRGADEMFILEEVEYPLVGNNRKMFRLRIPNLVEIFNLYSLQYFMKLSLGLQFIGTAKSPQHNQNTSLINGVNQNTLLINGVFSFDVFSFPAINL
jgi:hypothetical protein